MTIGIDLGDVWSHYCTINEEGRSLTALMQEGLVWGAIDFGGGSGDVMHFDCRRGISDC